MLEIRHPALELVERSSTVRALDSRLDVAGQLSGGTTVVSGPWGSGRSSVLRAAAARAHGRRVLWAQGRRDEQDLPLGVARQWLAGATANLGAGTLAELRGGSSGQAVELLLERPGAPRVASEVRASLTALAARLAEARPLLLVLDDAGWADPASLRWLTFLARRLERVPVALLLSVAEGESTASRLVAELLEAPDTAVHHLQPLTRRGVAALCGVEPALADSIAARTGGRALLVAALADALADAARPAVAELVPERVARRIGHVLDGLSGDAVVLARALAVLGPGPLAWAAELSSLEEQELFEAVDALTAAGLVLPDADRVSVWPPLVEAAVLHGMPVGRVALLRARAAEVLEAAGAPLDAVAEHLLRLPRLDARHVALLRRAALQAGRRGDPERASALLRRALTGRIVPGERPALLLECGRAAVSAGQPDGVELLHQAVEATSEPVEAAELALEVARTSVLAGHARSSIRLLEDRLAGPPLPDPLARRLRSRLVEASHLDTPLAVPLSRPVGATALERHAPAAMDERGVAAGEAVRRTHALEGPVGEVRRLALRAWDRGQLLIDGGPEDPTITFVTFALGSSGYWSDEADVSEAVLRAATDGGSVIASATARYIRSVTRLHLGDPVGALADATAALEARDAGWTTLASGAVWIAASAWIELDELDRAQDLLTINAPDPSAPRGVLDVTLLTTQATIHLARGAPAAALRLTERIAAETEDAAFLYGAEWPLVRTESLVRLGRPGDAALTAGRYVERMRAWGADGRIGAALRMLAMAEGADHQLLACAVEHLERSEDRLELIRALLDLGTAHRRAGRRSEAQPPLRRGLELAAQHGAKRLGRLVRQELAVAGYRPRRVATEGIGALTPSERRVCELAAQGHSNKRIAETLVVTVKTVEKHLSNAYIKLDLTGRRALTAAFAELGAT